MCHEISKPSKPSNSDQSARKQQKEKIFSRQVLSMVSTNTMACERGSIGDTGSAGNLSGQFR